MKQCSKCNQTKALSCFSKNGRQKDGLCIWCKHCACEYTKARYMKNADHFKRIQREYNSNNVVKIREGHKAYYDIPINQLKIVWTNMLHRCINSTDREYKNYGGRGITVCQRWLDSFEDFAKDMGDRPTPQHSIDRIDNDGNYSPPNCRWSTKKEQNNNQRRNK